MDCDDGPARLVGGAAAAADLRGRSADCEGGQWCRCPVPTPCYPATSSTAEAHDGPGTPCPAIDCEVCP